MALYEICRCPTDRFCEVAHFPEYLCVRFVNILDDQVLRDVDLAKHHRVSSEVDIPWSNHLFATYYLYSCVSGSDLS